MGVALSMRNSHKAGGNCPVASLLIDTWNLFFSAFRWRPAAEAEAEAVIPSGDLKQQLFIWARLQMGVKEAADLSSTAFKRCVEAGVLTKTQLSNWWSAAAGTQGFSQDADPASCLLAEVASTTDGVDGLLEVMLKGLSSRHRYFLWRVLVSAFFLGINALRMGLQDVSCPFCKTGVEDASHVFWLCPRWSSLWRDLAAHFEGFGELWNLRVEMALIPEVLLWAQSACRRTTFFRIWLLATVWRILWAERCISKFQGKRQKVTIVRVVLTMLEELRARQDKLDKRWVKEFATILLSVVPVAPQRYQILLREE
ncbi:hypothetical protein R1sor_017800 [Riccia sorocarpa]|uniref:Reverse transcriptase zinc-binding domain-containing protein n=1 Tax=Riccia sorocarpa TaxID=122646 RepID=A0ABD3I7V5_9MARC